MLLVVMHFACCGPVLAGSALPSVDITSAQRELDVLVTYSEQEPPKGKSVGNGSDIIHTATGDWNQSLTYSFPLGLADSTQESRIGRFSSHGVCDTYASLSDAVFLGSASAACIFQLELQSPTDVPFELSASFDFQGDPATAWTYGRVLMVGGVTNGFFFHEVDSEDPKTWFAFLEDTLVADVPTSVLFMVHSQKGKDTMTGDNETGVVEGSMTFSLNFGDRDDDGLLDVWEIEDRIEIAEGAVIDFAALGFDPDPDKKDLFVEVDVVHPPELIDLQTGVLDWVKLSFANAPGHLIGNEDGSTGVNLHAFVDETLVAAPSVLTLTGTSPNLNLPEEYYTTKKGAMGTAEIRANKAWNAGPLRDAWAEVFRYALIIDRVQEVNGDCPMDLDQCNPASGHAQYGGWAEAIPSNDFVVAAGHLKCRNDQAENSTTDEYAWRMAGAFMHELGHALGLRHGGFGDAPVFKPNYLSVMNYSYGNLFTATTAEDTNPREAFLLDYSVGGWPILNENNLVESNGFMGPESCFQPLRPNNTKCVMIFNSAHEFALRPRLTIAHAMADEIDWNHNGTISEKPLDPKSKEEHIVDLNRFGYNGSCRVTSTAEYTSLGSASDWDRLVYEPPEGTMEPNYEEPRKPAVISARSRGEGDPRVELTHAQFFAIQEADWVDQREPEGATLPFMNGFESAVGPRNPELQK